MPVSASAEACSPARMTSAAGARSHWPRQGERCHATARTHSCVAFELLAQLLGARQATGDVVTHVNDGARLGLGPKEMIEGDDAPGLRGRDGQATADVVESASTDPPTRSWTAWSAGRSRSRRSCTSPKPPRETRVSRPDGERRRPIPIPADRAIDRRRPAPRCWAQPRRCAGPRLLIASRSRSPRL